MAIQNTHHSNANLARAMNRLSTLIDLDKGLLIRGSGSVTIPGSVATEPTLQDVRASLQLIDNSVNGTALNTNTQFYLDGLIVSVTEDTVTPSNNSPLPVKLTGVSGDINITAGDLNVQLSDKGATPDITRIGDGVEELAINADGSINVQGVISATGLALEATQLLVKANTDNLDVALSTRLKPADTLAGVTLVGTLDTITNVVSVDDNGGSLTVDGTVDIGNLAGLATEATLSTINGKLVNGNDIGDVTVNNIGGVNAVNVQDGGNSLTVDAIDLDIRNLAATQDNVAISDGVETMLVNPDGSINVVSNLATGLALETTQLKVQSANELNVWDSIIGNSKVLSYYTGIVAGNPSGNKNVQIILYKTGVTTIVTKTFTWDVDDDVLTIIAS